MKRNLAIIIAASLTTMIGMVVFIAVLSIFASPTEANQDNPAPTVEKVIANEPVELQDWKVVVEATAQATNRELEATVQARETALQAQINQRRQSLSELDGTSQAQIGQMEVQLVEFQAQIDQTQANLPAIQAQIAALQQAIQNDDAAYQNELANLVESENQMRLQLEAAYAELNAAYEALAQRQAAAAAAVGPSGGDHGDDDDHDDKGEHEDHEDDEDDEHEDEDDD